MKVNIICVVIVLLCAVIPIAIHEKCKSPNDPSPDAFYTFTSEIDDFVGTEGVQTFPEDIHHGKTEVSPKIHHYEECGNYSGVPIDTLSPGVCRTLYRYDSLLVAYSDDFIFSPYRYGVDTVDISRLYSDTTVQNTDVYFGLVILHRVLYGTSDKCIKDRVKIETRYKENNEYNYGRNYD